MYNLAFIEIMIKILLEEEVFNTGPKYQRPDTRHGVSTLALSCHVLVPTQACSAFEPMIPSSVLSALFLLREIGSHFCIEHCHERLPFLFVSFPPSSGLEVH